jgi:hypothetical protein
MAIARTEYARGLVEDALVVSTDPVVVHAIILTDAINGVRKALLDVAESNRQIADELAALIDAGRPQ